MKNSILFIYSIIVLGILSCKKDSDTIDNSIKAPVYIEFDHLAGGQKLQLGASYTNALGQDFTVELLKYYVSNVKLVSTSGAEYVVPQDSSYFLIDFAANNIASVNVPEGDYNKLIFTLGVDSLRSTMDVSKRTGALDPGNDMYWQWNSGYRFLAIEGSSSFAVSNDKKYRYHIGGFGGYDTPTLNNIKIIEIDLTPGGIVKARKDRKSQVHLFADILKIFNGENNIDFSANNSTIMSINELSAKIANNYTSMFTHDHTHN